ncbi:MAG: HlyD family efflux transporter periplasmic adaptor subunit [Ramlibacter sp.]
MDRFAFPALLPPSRAGRVGLTCLWVAAATWLAGCDGKAPAGWHGYVEGEYILVAAPTAGRLERRFVDRGAQVASAAPLFVLEQENEKASRQEAQERLNNAQARLANLQGARRGNEIDAIRAQQREAIAARDLSAEQLAQQQRLFTAKFVSQAAVDAARASYQRDVARVAEATAQLATAQQSIGRDKEIAAAQADVDAQRAVLAQSEWRLAQRAVQSPSVALVQETFYSAGEWVQAGAPVVSLLPPNAVKLRFFVAEGELPRMKAGAAVRVTCDGCGTPIRASINFISRQAEYTPPVIYSREQRSRLVFMVEARPQPADAARLRPGQPVDVALE